MFAIGPLLQKPKPAAEGQPAPKKLSPVTSGVLVMVGLGLVFAGAAWRLSSQELGRR